MKRTLSALNLAAISFVSFWAYASHRNNGFNVGGQQGDVDFWIRMRDIGYFGTLCLWILCMLVSIWAAIANKGTPLEERIRWTLFAVLGAPLAVLSVAIYFNAIY